jgi:hypothetical protein
MTINTTDREFIESHKVYFEQARMKFLHGFAPGTMDRFYEIYVRYINPGYVLTPWCSECVIDMVSRLGTWYAQMQDDEMLAVIVASWCIPFPEEAELVEVKSAGNSLDAPQKRGKGRPKKAR